MSSKDVLSAARRSEQVWWEQICEWESLDYGVAYTCERYPSLTDAQQLRDVWLADIDGCVAFDRAESYYSERNLTCCVWTPASGQEEAPVSAIMAEKGWRREDLVVLGLEQLDQGPTNLTLGDVRVLPARPMRRSYRTFLESIHAGDESACNAAFDRLDDASYEVLLAVRDGEAVGRIGYHDVGDVGRIREFSISSDDGIDDLRRLLLAHFLLRARRLSPRVIVACCLDTNPSEITFLNDCGFIEAGRLVRFRRPA